jgi:hypothetical protein
MATGKRSRKPEVHRAAEPPKTPRSSKNVLAKMSPGELAVVLQALLKKHPDLKPEAEAVAIEMVSFPSFEDIAEDVLDAVASLGIDAFHGRAGKQPWGYVDPSQAAWDLLGEAVEDVVADMKRRMELGLETAAETICCGIVMGLHKAKGVGSDGPLGWAPDFPAEEACHTVAELIRTCPAEDRSEVHDRLIEALGDLVPGWHKMLSRAAERALHGK